MDSNSITEESNKIDNRSISTIIHKNLENNDETATDYNMTTSYM